MTKKHVYFKIFCNVSKAFGTSMSEEALLALIVQSAVDTMSGKAACIFLADEDKNVFVPKAQTGLSDSYLHAAPMKAKRLVKEISKGGYLHFRDATTDPRLENHAAKKAEGIASILAVPVRVRDKAIGVLSLYTGEPRDFDPEEIELLDALADQGGVAIENGRLLERIQKNSMLFLEMATSINSSLDIKEVLHHMTAGTCEAFNIKGATIRLRNDETGVLDLLASHGLSDEFLGKGPVSAEKSVAEALKGKTVVIKNVKKDKRLQYREETIQEGIASMVCIPIRLKDEVIGVFRLYSEKIEDFPQDFLIILEALAHLGALAIQNASMYLALQEEKDTLQGDIQTHRSYF